MAAKSLFAVPLLGVLLVGVLLVGSCLVSAPAALAQAVDGRAATGSAASAADLQAFAQAQTRPKRAPTRIRVSPRCRSQTETLDYPPPWDCNTPGPGYVRNCSSRLVQENRPSGTVIVPLTRCWWEPG